ncbi:unnamed protein product [Euphydryas editha]|uniref:MSP domain-containing protein n=1 Tax=Euphydryas editha TaxID=104508 RepID=A0AAU9TVM6_EUPED|nr:unnamed protein product [Euphydryas editha]
MQSKNIRIIGKYDCDNDIEEDLKELERQYRIDFKSLTQWKNIIEKINSVKQECKMKLINAKNRNFRIIEKLYIQNYRTSPFVLTDKFSRTSKLWKEEKLTVRQQKTSSKTEYSSMSLHNVSIDNVIPSEENDIESNAHPNSEVAQSKEHILKQNIEPDSHLNSPQYLPPFICTNQHKLLSSIGSSEIVLNHKESKNNENNFKTETIEDLSLKQTKLVQCYPEKIIITSNTLREQILKFSILNTSTEYVYIRFKNLSDTFYFKSFRMSPLVPIKLNPGLSKHYKFNFTLRDSIDVNVISLVIYFRVCSKISEEILCLPLKGQIERCNSLIVTETVKIPQVYLWQVNAKCGYPKGIVQIQVCDNTAYSLYIRKKDLDFKESVDTRSSDSLKVITPNTESLMQKTNDNEMELQNKTILSPKGTEINAFDIVNIENETLNSFDIVTLVLNDILNIVYEPFIFKNTFLRLKPKSKRIALVYFTKAEHIGYHQSNYELTFYDSNDNVFTKTVKVFGEVLPHPIVIYPNILDLIKSPVIFGHCKDHFTIINTHKVYPVSIKIQTATKMNKIFQITPRVVSIPAKSNVKFNIKLCREHINASQNVEIMAYFTIKIIVSGHRSVYQNVPPVYYEIIAPCTKEFMKTYKIEYIDDSTALSSIETFQNDYVNNF